MYENGDLRAEVLIESMGFIKKFYDKIVVIKYGGHAMVSEELKKSVIRDIVLLRYIGMHPVIVHGGGPMISEIMEERGIVPEYKDGLRVTSPEVMKITEMVLSGYISPDITAHFNADEVKSVSISGKDARFIRAKVKSEDLGLVGEVTRIDTQYILGLINQGYVPVVSPIAYGEGGQSLNINSDTVATKLASALGAEKLILITDVPGVLRDVNDFDSLIKRMTVAEAEDYIEEGIITGGMIPKLECCIGAINGGVRRCHIINGTHPHSILIELFTSRGIGTMVTNNY